MSEPAVTVRAAHMSGTQGGVSRLVFHDEEYPVSDTSAEAIAGYFSQDGAGGSAHYVIDANSEQHCVPDNVVAWHSPPNQGSIGIEQDGYSRNSRADWLTDGSKRTIARTCARMAELMVRFQVPCVRLFAGDLLAGRRGYCGHGDVSAAWHQSDHSDPGAGYPFDIAHPLMLEGIRRLSGDAAVRAFQAERHLAVDGDPGLQTVMALGSYLYEHWMSGDGGGAPVPPANRFAPMAAVAENDNDPAGGTAGRVILDYTRPVQSLQSAINVCDKKDSLTLDGSFGPATTAALKRYQGFFFRSDPDGGKAATDGVCGGRSWALFDWILDGMHR